MVTCSSMPLSVQLVRDGKVILEIPLEREEWEKVDLDSELEQLESALDESTDMHDVFSNRVRSRMLWEMVRSSDRRFSELMDLMDANQKIVSENLQRMMRKGLVERVVKRPGEVHYVPTDLGFATTLTCVVMQRILDELEE